MCRYCAILLFNLNTPRFAPFFTFTISSIVYFFTIYINYLGNNKQYFLPNI
jgi:hypothetical protein